MKFSYKARTKEGKVEAGVIEANSKEAAVLLLQKYNVFVTSLQEGGIKEAWSKKVLFEKKVSKKDLAIFFRQLSVMLESRVPVVQSLQSLAVQTKKQGFKEAITKIASLVEEGSSLSEALSNYPNMFESFYINLVKSGETSGKISGSLYYISENLEREDDIIVQVRQAMVYPLFVVGVLFIVMGIIIVQVMPRIADLIKESNVKPSFLTRVMLDFYQFLGNYWWLVLLILLSGIALGVYYVSTVSGKKNIQAWSLRLPFLKTLLKKVYLSRFCGNVATLLSAGISINKALAITEETVNNSVYKNIITDIEKQVSEGEKISAALKKHEDYFPSFVVQMIKVGEETGKLDKTLLEVVTFYQKEIKRSVNLFSSLIEPVMITFLGIVVTFLAISVLSPLYGALGTI